MCMCMNTRVLVDDNIVNLESKKIDKKFKKIKLNPRTSLESMKDKQMLRKCLKEHLAEPDVDQSENAQISDVLNRGEYMLELPEWFGKSQWPTDLLHEFFEHLTLAVDQPNEDDLKRIIKKNIELVTPFANKGHLDETYRYLEKQMTDCSRSLYHGTKQNLDFG